MNNILIIGCGSIGQRHLEALIKLGEKNIAAYRTFKGSKKKFQDDLGKNVKTFYDLDEAINWEPTHIIISNPTKFHLKYLKIGIENNNKIFIEKPISDSIDDIVNSGLSKKKIINYKRGIVGYNLRFNKLFQTIYNVIKSKKYGNVISAYLEVGHYLPFWHPYEDYKKSYAARKDLGGGVINTLSHEIDLTYYFFGRIKKVFAHVEKISNLEIDVDDNTDIFIKSQNCKSVRIHMDYLKPKPIRKGEIQFDKGLLEYDFNNSIIFFTDYNKKSRVIIFDEKVEYNQQYIDQMKFFVSDNKNKIACTLNEGIDILEIIKKCKLSNKEGVEYEIK